MDRIITREKLCETIKMSDSSLRKFISRKVIIEEKKGFIDLDNESNKIYIIKYAAKKGIDCETIFYKNVPEQKEEIETGKEQPKNLTTYSRNQSKKLQNEIQKIQIDTRLKYLELEKKKAKVLPLDFVIEWSGLNIKGIFSETENFGDIIIDKICNELDADVHVKLKYRKIFREGFREVLKNGIKNQKSEALEQAHEFSLRTKW